MVLKSFGPPSSPPTTGLLLKNRMKMASRASIQKMVTENPKLKGKNKSCYHISTYNMLNIPARLDLED